jgi:dihydroorotate dehydrogenase
VREARLPVIAAGGIMDGAGVAAVLDLGAVAAQLGTAIACRKRRRCRLSRRSRWAGKTTPG